MNGGENVGQPQSNDEQERAVNKRVRKEIHICEKQAMLRIETTNQDIADLDNIIQMMGKSGIERQ